MEMLQYKLDRISPSIKRYFKNELIDMTGDDLLLFLDKLEKWDKNQILKGKMLDRGLYDHFGCAHGSSFGECDPCPYDLRLKYLHDEVLKFRIRKLCKKRVCSDISILISNYVV
jgi:hypothetical protein